MSDKLSIPILMLVIYVNVYYFKYCKDINIVTIMCLEMHLFFMIMVKYMAILKVTFDLKRQANL